MLTSRFEQVWEKWGKPIVIYAILWGIFHDLLDLGDGRSLAFTLLFGACYFKFKELSKKTEKAITEARDFVPYRVSVYLHNPRGLFFKYNLVKTEEDWKQLCEQTTDTSVFRRGLNFTVLSLDKDGLPHLVWWDDHKTFLVGTPSFKEALWYLNDSESPTPPSLYFGSRHGTVIPKGDNLALCVDARWWEENKITDNIETEKEWHTGSIYLTLGTLPFWEIGLGYEARRRDRKTELEKLGWTIKDSHEPNFNWHEWNVQNEYFSVSQQSCEMETIYWTGTG